MSTQPEKTKAQERSEAAADRVAYKLRVDEARRLMIVHPASLDDYQPPTNEERIAWWQERRRGVPVEMTHGQGTREVGPQYADWNTYEPGEPQS